MSKPTLVLTQAEKDEFVSKHLKYRLNCLLAQDLLDERIGHSAYNKKFREAYAEFVEKNNFPYKEHPYNDGPVLAPVYEVSLIVGRNLLQFLGIRLNGNREDIDWKFSKLHEDVDITVKTIDPNRVDKSILNHPEILNNKKEIIFLLNQADRSVAHSTNVILETIPEDQELVRKARKAILKLFQHYFPTEIDYNKEVWWCMHVEPFNP